METKVCIKCKEEKPLTEFYKDRTCLTSRCKSCLKEKIKIYRASENGKEVRKKYNLSARGKEISKKCNEKRKNKQKKYHKTEKWKEYLKKFFSSDKGVAYRKKSQERSNVLGQTKARSALMYAIRTGRVLKQPCELCNSDKNIVGHHFDYNQPLNVVWLYSKCHGEHHAELRRIRNG